VSISLRAGRCVGLGSRFASPSTSAAMFSLTWPPSVFQKRTSPSVHHSAAIEHWTPRNNVEKIARLGTTVMRTLRCSFWGNAPIGKEPSTGKASEMKRVRSRRIGRPRRSVQKRPRVRRKDLPTVKLPGLAVVEAGRRKLTNHRAAVILHTISCGCYRETATQLAGVTPEPLCHWMRWAREPYRTFQRLVRKAEADLEAHNGDCADQPSPRQARARPGDS
jgi:hypothetical protein